MGVMPSDRRFHPLTVLFALGGELRNFIAPILFASFTARSRGGDMQNWFLIFMIPSVLIAASRYWFSTYRYAETELVVRTGIFFKNERHIPYARIQSVDAKQNVFHRFFKVVDVKVQTGTGGEVEATLSVLPFEALEEMRSRVFEGKRAAGVAVAPGEIAVEGGQSEATVAPVALPVGETILHLPIRETALSGLLDNRGWVVIGAATGLVWESGFVDRFIDQVESLQSFSQTPWTIVAAVAVGLFVVSPILSVVWAAVRLHGFTLTRRGGELLTEYGALTRVTGTVPLRRVQAVKIVRSPGHLLTGRAAIRVETAGGAVQGAGVSEREWVAPIIHIDRVPAFVQGLLPDVALDAVVWKPADDRAAQRRMRLAVYVALVLGAGSAYWLEWYWAATLTAGFCALGVVGARQYVHNLGWSRSEHAIYFRSGWLWKSVTIVPVPKVQAVTLQESPFDRRWQMASVAVDTAGAGAHAVDVPYLSRAVAEELRLAVATQAAATTYRW
jgi:putative membrane protein